MSVLLIGMDSDTYTSSFRVRRNKKKQVDIDRQQGYRNELLEQIREKQNRMRKMKELEQYMDQKRQEAIAKELKMRRTKMKKFNGMEEKYHQGQLKSKHNNQILDGYRNRSEVVSSQQDKKVQFKLPSLSRNLQYKTNYRNSYETPEKHHYKQNQRYYPRRIKTQQPAQPVKETEQLENPEDWHTSMKKYQDQKFNEVYELLVKSYDIVKGTKDKYQTLPAQISEAQPDKRYSSIINEPYSQFYQLPRTEAYIEPNYYDRQYNYREKEWQLWFANQRLEQIKAEIKKKQINDEIQQAIIRNRSYVSPKSVVL